MNWVTALKANEKNGLKHVYDKYHAQLYSYIYSKTHSRERSEEVVQLTFIKLWEKRYSLNEEMDISFQIFRIARTTLIDEIRKAKTIEKVAKAAPTPYGVENGVEEQIFYNDTRRKLEKLILDMPPIRQKVFWLSRYGDCSAKEIAEQLSISPKTVQNHINLALRTIKPFFTFLVLLMNALNWDWVINMVTI